MATGCVFLLFLMQVMGACSADPYIDKTYPYQMGPLKVNKTYVTGLTDGSPTDSLVFFPVTPGDYPVFVFVPGLNGFLFSSAYTQFLSNVSSHGFITISNDFVDVDNPNEKYDDDENYGIHFGDLIQKQIIWMQTHLPGVLAEAGAPPGVVANWNKIGMGSHSAGAVALLYIVDKQPTLAKALLMFDPVAMTFNTAVNFSLPLLMPQTELSTEHKGIFPPCVIEQYGYKHIWDLWPQPPKMRMEIMKFGHCGILDPYFWNACNSVCVATQNQTSLPSYHVFTQGITKAFLNTYVNGFTDDLKYVINQTLVPETLTDIQIDL